MSFILAESSRTSEVQNKISSYNGESKYNYEYPDGLDLVPGSELSNKLVQTIVSAVNSSRSDMVSRYDSWNKIDRTLTVYVSPETKEEEYEDKKSKETIIIPMSYAILDVLVTYMMTVFLPDPIIRYEGVGPEDSLNAMLLQKIIEQDVIRNKVGLNLLTNFRDSFAYGIGAGVCGWKIDEIFNYRTHEKNFKSMLGNIVSVFNRTPHRTYQEGNEFINIDPYQLILDPDVSINNIQNGEYVGWLERTNYQSLLSDEQSSKGKIFNCRYLKRLDGRSVYFMEGDSNSGRKLSGGNSGKSNSTGNTVDIISLYVNLIPKDFGIGNSEYPEKWIFRVAGDAVIIEARPIRLNHNKFPVVVNAPDFDGYSISPISKLETIMGLQDLADWLIQSRMANVKSTINNMILVDPYLVNMNDLKTPKPGKLIRMRRAAWGKGKVSEAIEQFKMTDVTSGNFTDMAIIENIAKYATSATDNLQGTMQRRGERISASEVNKSWQGAVGRLERSAKVTSLMTMQDIGYFFGFHTQQFLSKKTYVKTIGDWERVLREEYGMDDRVPVGPADTQCNFDIVPKDGTVPSSENAQSWIQMYQIMAQSPALATRFDMLRVGQHIFTLMGAKSVDNFINRGVQTQIMPDEVISRQAERGNLVGVDNAV